MTEDRQRIDKWLWFARVCKSRTLAQKLVLSGDVRINDARIGTSSHPLKAGDVVAISTERHDRVLKVTGLGTRRGPAAEAALLYEDVTPPPAEMPPATPSAGPRPTKRQRRALDAIAVPATIFLLATTDVAKTTVGSGFAGCPMLAKGR
jgi:ribosome-associated heat shock protein Hsp15